MVGKCRNQGPPDPVSGEDPPPGLQMAVFWLCPLTVDSKERKHSLLSLPMGPFDHSRGLHPHDTSFPKPQLLTNTVTLGVRLHHRNCVGDAKIHSVTGALMRL